MTYAEYLAKLHRLKEEEEKKNENENENKLKKAKTGKATKRKPPKKINFDTLEPSDNAQEEEREEICGTRSDKSDGMSHSLLDNKEELRQLWKKLSPPVPEESVVQQWY